MRLLVVFGTQRKYNFMYGVVEGVCDHPHLFRLMYTLTPISSHCTVSKFCSRVEFKSVEAKNAFMFLSDCFRRVIFLILFSSDFNYYFQLLPTSVRVDIKKNIRLCVLTRYFLYLWCSRDILQQNNNSFAFITLVQLPHSFQC